MIKCLSHGMSTLAQKIDHKRAIKEFYRNVHPDTIQTAPKRVKEENLRSLSMLNDYIDKIRKNEGSTSIKVKFYAPEKDNKKSKRYYYFEAQLDNFSPNSDPEFVELLEKRVITKLVSNLKATQYYNNPLHKKTEGDKYSNDIQKTAEEHIQENSSILAKSSTKREVYSDLSKFKQGVVNYESKKQKEEIMKGIQKNLYVFFDDLSYKDFYSEEIFKDLTFNILERKLREKEIELQLYYIEEELDTHDVFNYFKKLSKGMKNEEFKKHYMNLQNRIMADDPRVKILLSNVYKVNKGFIHIDIHDDINKTMDYIEDNIENALSDREEQVTNENLLKTETKKISEQFKLSSVDFSRYDAECGSDIEMSYTKKFIFLKKIAKLAKTCNNSLQDFTIYLYSNNKIEHDSKNLTLRWNFNEEDIARLIDQPIN